MGLFRFCTTTEPFEDSFDVILINGYQILDQVLKSH